MVQYCDIVIIRAGPARSIAFHSEFYLVLLCIFVSKGKFATKVFNYKFWNKLVNSHQSNIHYQVSNRQLRLFSCFLGLYLLVLFLFRSFVSNQKYKNFKLKSFLAGKCNFFLGLPSSPNWP